MNAICCTHMRMHVCVRATYVCCSHHTHACMHACVRRKHDRGDTAPTCIQGIVFSPAIHTSQTEGPSRLRSLGWHGMAWQSMHGTLFPGMESMPCLALPSLADSAVTIFPSPSLRNPSQGNSGHRTALAETTQGTSLEFERVHAETLVVLARNVTKIAG